MEKYKTTWDLTLLYKGPNDPQIEKDLKSIEQACARFEKKYRNSDFTSTPKKLLVALQDSEKLGREMLGSKPWWYFTLSFHMNLADSNADAKQAKYESKLSIASNKTTFFHLKIAEIPKAKQKLFLKSPILKDYHRILKHVFDDAKYNLSEKEENILNLLGQTSYSMWVNAEDKILLQKTVSYKGEQISFSKAREILPTILNTKERRELHTQILDVLEECAPFAEPVINAICNYKKVVDQKRGFKKPYSATLLGNENDEKSIENLAKIVTKNFPIVHRFYRLHKKLLKLDQLTQADVGAKIGVIKKDFSFEKTVELVRGGFAKIGSDYANILDKFLENGQIDVNPRVGKYGGGYCWKMGENPTFILLNHNNSIRSVETLAHEMGHAIHNEFGMVQPTRYQGHSTSVAEVASTFFEQVVNEELEPMLNDQEKMILLHNKIYGDVSTIFVQIACFNFETELHNRIRDEGQISKEDIADLMVKHLQACRGELVNYERRDGYHFVDWSHIRMFFYTYTYAFGQIISKAMFQKWKNDKSFEKKLRAFLSSGTSLSPKDIFKSLGIDITKDSFFESGLKAIDEDITKLEKLAKKNKLI